MRKIIKDDLVKDGAFYRFRDTNLSHNAEVEISEPLDIVFGTIKCDKLIINNHRTRIIAHNTIASEIKLVGYLCSRTIDCPELLCKSWTHFGEIRTNTELTVSGETLHCNRPPIDALCGDCGNRCIEHGTCFLNYTPDVTPILIKQQPGADVPSLDVVDETISPIQKYNSDLKILRIIKA